MLHRRFWHAKLQDMKLLPERGGVDILDDEIQAVITACPVCRKLAEIAISTTGEDDLAGKLQ